MRPTEEQLHARGEIANAGLRASVLRPLQGFDSFAHSWQRTGERHRIQGRGAGHAVVDRLITPAECAVVERAETQVRQALQETEVTDEVAAGLWPNSVVDGLRRAGRATTVEMFKRFALRVRRIRGTERLFKGRSRSAPCRPSGKRPLFRH